MLSKPGAPQSPKLRTTSVKVKLRRPVEPVQGSSAMKSIDSFSRPLRNLDNKLFDNKRMTSTHLKLPRKQGPETERSGRSLVSQTILPCTVLEKKGIRQSILNQVTVLLLVSKKLQRLRNAARSDGCVKCILDAREASACRQLDLFAGTDSAEFLCEVERFSIGNYFKHLFTRVELQPQSSMLKSLDYLVNNSCREPNFKKAVEEVVAGFNLSKEGPTRASRAASKCRQPGRSPLVKSVTLRHARIKSAYKGGLNVSTKALRASHLNLKKSSVAFSIQMLKQNIFGRAKAFRLGYARSRKAKPKAKGKRKAKERQRAAAKKRKILKRKCGNSAAKRAKEFSKKMLWWYIGRQIAGLKSQFSGAANQNEYKQFCQNLFLDRFSSTRVVLIDCRFKYEFDGGHIRGAFNVCNPEVVRKLFFNHGWINTPEFLDHIEQFKDSHLDLRTANHILAEYEKKLLLRITRKNEGSRLSKRGLGFTGPRASAFGAHKPNPVKDLFLNKSRQAEPEPRGEGACHNGNIFTNQYFSSKGSAHAFESMDQEQKPRACTNFSFDLEKQQKQRLLRAKQGKRGASKNQIKSERIIKWNPIRKGILRAEKLPEWALLNGGQLIKTLLSNQKDAPDKPGGFQDSHRRRRLLRLQSKTFENNRKSAPLADKASAVVIFYCEFSSRRAPKMFNFFRNLDRVSNHYPNLHYPHIFLMKGGYEQFVENFKHFCTRPLEPAPGAQSMDAQSDAGLAPKLGSLELFAEPRQLALTVSQVLKAKLKSRMMLKSSKVISEKSSEVNEFLSKDDEYDYKQTHNLMESLLLLPTPLMSESIFQPGFIKCPNSQTSSSNVPATKPARPGHVKHRSMQVDLRSGFIENLLQGPVEGGKCAKKAPEKRAKSRKKKRQASANKRGRVARKTPAKKEKALPLLELKQQAMRRVTFPIEDFNAASQRPRAAKVPRRKRDNKRLLKRVFNDMNFKGKSSLVSKVRLRLPETFKTPFFSNLRAKRAKQPKKPRRPQAGLKAPARKRKRNKSTSVKKPSRKRRGHHKKVKSSIEFVKQSFQMAQKPGRPSAQAEDFETSLVAKTLSVDRYRKMSDPKFKTHYISANKEYRVFWMETALEEKRNRCNRTLSVQ